MGEYVIVGLLVGAAALLAARNIYRSLAGKQSGCSCGQRCPPTTGCPMAQKGDKPAEDAAPK